MSDKPATPPPAYFLSLSLENVRSFGKKQTISFATAEGRPAQWTIILGDNGVGKTTILKSLAGMTRGDGNDEDGAIHMWRHLDKIWNPIRNMDDSTAIIIAENSINTLLEEREIEYDKLEFAAYIRQNANKRGSGSYRETRKNIHVFSRLRATANGINRSLVCYGYGAGRSIGNTTIGEGANLFDTCASLFDDRADLLNPEEWFLFADYTMAKDKDPLTIQNFNLLKAALLEVMAEGDVADMEVSPVSLGGGSPRQGVRFKTPYGWVRLKDMSLGYQTLVVWLTDFASKLFIRYPKSKNPLREPAIILIDEIDLHLHPSWQRKLISSLSRIFTNTQFIATAHSPLVVQAATDAEANVVLLKREGDETIVYQGHDLPDVRRWRIEQILSSELFDDTPPLSAQTQADLERRNQLRLKKRLTAKEKAELTQLDATLTSQPVGTTAPERRAEDLLAQLARNLGQSELLH